MACFGTSYHAAANKKEKDQDDTKNQQPGDNIRKPITELQNELYDIKKQYSDLEGIHKYTSERDSKWIWELLYRPIPSTQHLQDLERSFYEANKLVENIDEYNFYWRQHTALINLLIEANHARLVAETTADHWRQRFEKEKTSKTWT